MQKLFYLYLSVSLSASVIIAVLFLCRPLWKRRFSKSWQYYIWLLAVVRLLIPLSPAPGMIGRAADWARSVWPQVSLLSWLPKIRFLRIRFLRFRFLQFPFHR